MKIAIKRWGNGAVIPLTKALREHLNSDVGDAVEVEVLEEGLLIKREKSTKYSLEKLLSSCTSQNTSIDDQDIAWLHNILMRCSNVLRVFQREPECNDMFTKSDCQQQKKIFGGWRYGETI